MTASNRRQFSRILFHSEARLAVAGQTVDVDVVDLSLKGALVRAKKPVFIQVGSNCELTLDLADADATINMEATIVHHQGDVYGLYCREIDLDSATHLHRLVELNLGDITLLERELAILAGS